jgi:hypothetical protein
MLKTNREGWYAYISTVERDIGTLSWVYNLGLLDYEINEQTNSIPCLLRRVYDEKGWNITIGFGRIPLL